MSGNKVTLDVRDLRTHFYTYEGTVKALGGVNLKVFERDALGVVGETGCGKSVTALSIMRLVPWPPGKIVGGEVLFRGEDLLKLSEEEMRTRIRGREMSMVFQEPIPALNPVITVGNQIAEVIEYREEETNHVEALKKSVDLLASVNIADPERIISQYPHQLSGGMAQRVMIAMALACHPRLLIADEPTTALDVTIQAQILYLIKDLMDEIDSSLMMITHDLGVIAETCKRVAVMYAGQVVETADIRTIFKGNKHPYTEGLLGSIPNPYKKEPLHIIKGSVPNMINPPIGCKFSPRCPYAMDICAKEEPPEEDLSGNHSVYCWLVTKGKR